MAIVIWRIVFGSLMAILIVRAAVAAWKGRVWTMLEVTFHRQDGQTSQIGITILANGKPLGSQQIDLIVGGLNRCHTAFDLIRSHVVETTKILPEVEA